jgi:carbamoyltransferase
MIGNMAIYGNHNASVALERDGKIVGVIELERFLSSKNIGWSRLKTAKTRYDLWNVLKSFIEKEYGISSFNKLYSQFSTFKEGEKLIEGRSIKAIEDLIECNEKITSTLHHESHAYNTFYQSPYDKAIVISFDGGGNDGHFNVYLADRKKGLNHISAFKRDLGYGYALFGHYLKDIKKEEYPNDILVYPGKIMGLCGYGKVIEEWLDGFKKYYEAQPSVRRKYRDRIFRYIEPLVGKKFDENNRFSGQLAWDIAATSQRVFEDSFIEITKEVFNKYLDYPICITGGCGMNIILNTRIRDSGREVFVSPNTNDCGLSVGMLLKDLKPEKPVDVTYIGIPILDKYTLCMYAENNKTYPTSEVVEDLKLGKIVGLVQGNSEHGSRALGNRSILCNPTFPEMKGILNSKVKNREWYRPFAPVVRLELVSKYFEWEGESRWMSFCPKVRPEYRKILASITHVDGTARVQTVTKEQNKFLYELLVDFEKITGMGVLLNTSFNVAGKPILSTYSEAWDVYKQTEMDGLILEGYYFKKKH